MVTENKKRVLVVEDDRHIAEGLQLNLSLQGYDVLIAPDGLAGIQMWEASHPDLIILDIMLPGMDGLSVLQNIRLKDERIPVLILTAKGAPDEKVKGFSYGVDDYLVKPFNLEEFLLRVNRLLTRASWENGDDRQPGGLYSLPPTYCFGKNLIDFEKGTAVCQNRDIQLTEQEIKLIKVFIANRGKPLSRKKLLEVGWGYTQKTSTRTVDNFIVRLRKYFEDNPKKPVYFKSLRSVGYIFDHD